MAIFGPLAAEIDPVVWGTPANFNGFRVFIIARQPLKISKKSLITTNMQSKMGFPSSHQLKSFVSPNSHLKLAARCPVSGCWPSCIFSYGFTRRFE